MKPADIVSAEITDCGVKLILEKVLITYSDTNNDCVGLCIMLSILYNVCVWVHIMCVCVCMCMHVRVCMCVWMGELVDEVLVYMFITGQNVLAAG